MCSGAVHVIFLVKDVFRLNFFLLDFFFYGTSLELNWRFYSPSSYFFNSRERRMKVTDEDFKKSKENVLYRKQEGTPEGLYL